ncbi:hypothetical protein HO133_007287 [Letharia lupina]|uniref:Mitochondrial carrier protein pet8 protein n=1 Tax=Letharia lupina TaxID=560253 RepID=A0A8H6KYK0_9LECA|nr:uncharacterized protein HO133_007287 [Letharia lupina]KAF6229171.1 hypothetical protein HO133_007287 [Letharia lupina]
MSFITRIALRSRASPLRLAPISTRPLHVTSARAVLSESDHGGHHDAEDRKAKIDHHKDDQLNKQKDGKGHWKRELGSNSESAVKADREEITDAEHDVESLQKETSEAMEDDHEHAKK